MTLTKPGRSPSGSDIAGSLPRDRILLSAAAAFAERGFNGVTVRDLTLRAGVNLAAVNYHFRSKDHLYAAVIEFALSQWTSEVVVTDEMADDVPLATVVRAIVSALIAPVIDRESNRFLPRLLAWEVLQRPLGAKNMLEAPCAAVILKVLAPHLPRDMSRDEMALIVHWLVSQCLLLSPALGGKASGESVNLIESEQIAERVTDLALHGLLPITARLRPY